MKMNHGKTWQPIYPQKSTYSTTPIPERVPIRKSVQSNSAFIQQEQKQEERHKKSPMSSYSFYPGTPSFLAMKYLRTYTPSTNLMPGERYRLRRNMESKVPGYRDIANELRCVSEEIENQRFKSPEREQAPPTWIRNSPVGYVSQRTGGNTWIAAHYPSNIRFSRATTPMLTSCGKDRMDHVYRYYGTHRY